MTDENCVGTFNIQRSTSNGENLDLLRVVPERALIWSAATCRRFRRVEDLSATQDRVQRSEARAALDRARGEVSSVTRIPDVALDAPMLATSRQEQSGDKSPHSKVPSCHHLTTIPR